MVHALTPHQQAVVDALVSSGRFSNERQVLDEALELLKQRDELRAMLEIGVAQLDRGERHTADSVFSELRRQSNG
jgi:Arc/MetJ-type ribon-helix-helix transcriptional regulator